MDVRYATAVKFSGLAPLFDERQAARIKTVVRAHFNSLPEFVAAAPVKYQNTYLEASAWDDTDYQNRWAGCTFDTAQRLAREGWPEGAERAAAAHKDIQASMPQAPRMLAYDTTGAVPNVARFLSGNPLNMRTMKRTDSTRQPVVTFLIPSCASASEHVGKFETQAACAAALIDMLEAKGYRCEAYAYDMSMGMMNSAAEIMVKVKDAGSSLDLQMLAFAAGHPGMGRRLILAYEAAEPMMRFLGQGLGQPIAIKANPATGIYTLPDIPRYNRAYTVAENFKQIVLKHAKLEGCPGVDL